MEREEQCRRLHALPESLRARRQWLVWKFELYDGDKKPRKVPYYATTSRKRRGTVGDDDDRKNLATFDFAVDRLRHGPYDGIGFAFLPGDGLVGIDLDAMIDPDTGVVSERCNAIIAACASYTERSPSGQGVHIIVEGQTKTFKDNSIGVEVFCGSQYFTCTGDVWEGSSSEVNKLSELTLRRLQRTVETAREAARVQRNAPAKVQALPATNDFERVNRAALGMLDDWVPALFPRARKSGDKWRVTSKDLGRDLQEDLSLHRAGIQDWGTEKGMTPIDVVVEFGGKSPKEALTWFAKQLGLQLERSKLSKAGKASTGAKPDEGAETPLPRSAEGAEEDDPRGALSLLGRQLLGTNDGGVKDCRENVFHMLTMHPELKGLVGFDEFAHQVVKLRRPPWKSKPGEWTPNDDYELGLWLTQQARYRLVVKGEGTLIAGVAMAAFRNSYHPVLNYLRAQRHDGIGRLDHWVHECLSCADTPYNRMVGKWFIMGMVNRILRPGCQMDNMVILEGGQGRKKSSALRALAGEWFADTPIKIGDKDATLNLAGIWLYEIAELDSFNRAEVTAVKQYVSSRVDRVREPYARRPVDRPRQGVLAGTTNQNEYFKDPTGSRRFWPLAIEHDLDLDKIAAWRDQLFAEAIVALEAGERYYPTREESDEYIVPEQDRREIVDPWFERIATWLDAEEQLVKHSYTASQILLGALHVPLDRIDGARSMATRVGTAMHRLGWGKQRDATGARLWRYWRPGHYKHEHDQQPTGVPAAGQAVDHEDTVYEF